MLITRDQAQQINAGLNFVMNIYEFNNESLSLATHEINQRYPQEGRLRNKELDEIYYIFSGNGTIHTDDGDFQLKAGDAFLIKKGMAYWVDADNLKFLTVTTPHFNEAQQERLPDA